MENKMDVKWVPLSDITPYAGNAKKHPKDQVKNLAESLKQFGWKQPLVIDGNGVICIGHGRYAAAKLLKLDAAPCLIADDLTDEQIKKLRLADNKLNESDWDLDILAEELEGLDFEGFDIDWGLISPDDFGEDFSLADGEKSPFVTMSFTLSNEQAELIKYAIEQTQEDIRETFGNTNKNGNGLYEVVRQWAKQRK